MPHFEAKLEIIGVNPFVFVPIDILHHLFDEAGKNKSPIPICGEVNGVPYKQNLMMFKGEWRLYINSFMLKNSPKRIGEHVYISIMYDPEDRTLTPHPKLMTALNEHPQAKHIFDQLRPSLQHEIVRTIHNLKTEASVDRNVIRAIDFLLGKGRFIGRDRP